MKKRIIIIVFTIIFLLLFFITRGYAYSNTLTIKFSNENATFKVYNLENFDIYNLNYSDKNVITMMTTLISKDKIKEDFSGKIVDEKVIFNNLKDGYYLITGESYFDTNYKYTIMPSLLKITSNKEITPKFEKEKLEKYNLKVIKSWNDDFNTHSAIKISLYKNNVKTKTIELNNENNFEYVFENLDRKDDYTVFEEDIPSGYTLEIVRDNDTITLINSFKNISSYNDIKNDKLPQTGLLQWPFLYLIVIGIVCILLSFIIKYKKIVMCIALFSLTITLILFLNNETESLEGQNNSNLIVNAMFKEINGDITDITKDISYITTVPEMATINIDGIDYIGTLEIPSQNLLLPVTSDWSMDKLKISPCRYSGSIYTDDFVICGHNYTKNRHFGVLKHVKIGDTIYFRTVNNETIEYKVIEAEILDPYDVYNMKNSDYDLTLFTCTYGGNERLTLRCNRFVR